MRKTQPSLIPGDFDIRFERAFGLLAFVANRHIIDHMRRLSLELNSDPNSALVWGVLAHLNLLPNLPLGCDPMLVLDEMGMKKDRTLVPVRLSVIVQVVGLPRETVRRKLELLRAAGKVERDADGKWCYLVAGVGQRERDFTRKTVLQLLKTAESMLQLLDQVNLDQPSR